MFKEKELKRKISELESELKKTDINFNVLRSHYARVYSELESRNKENMRLNRELSDFCHNETSVYAIIGKKNSGKTHYIVNNIIPKLNGNYVVIGSFGEYSTYGIPDDKIIDKELSMEVLMKNKDRVIIVENTTCFSPDKIRELNGFCMINKRAKVIAVFHSIGTAGEFLENCSKIYMIGSTVDHIKVKRQFFSNEKFRDNIIEYNYREQEKMD